MRPWLTSGRLLPGLTVRRLLTATPAARPLNKTMSAETADNAGTPQSKLLVMESIKEFPRGISDQTISASGSYGLTKRVRPGPGLQLSWSMHALTNRSHRLQATSFKQQASSNKLDMKDIMGYGIIKKNETRTYAQLNASRPRTVANEEKTTQESLGTGGHGPGSFFICPKIQASSGKHQAPSTKVQAPSRKRQAPGPWILEKVSR